MRHEFLSPAAASARDGFEPLARSPMERDARAAGARHEVRDGWNVAVGYASVEQEREALARAAGWADVSHLGKLELQGSAEAVAALVGAVAGGARLELGRATRAAGAWWCPVTPRRALVICPPAALGGLRERLEESAGATDGAGVVDVTTAFAALTLAGPLAREVFARFSAIDLRPQSLPLHGFRPGSVARGPGMVLREDDDRFLLLFGWALGGYAWSVVADAGRHLGGAPVGVDALAPIAEPAEELTPRA